MIIIFIVGLLVPQPFNNADYIFKDNGIALALWILLMVTLFALALLSFLITRVLTYDNVRWPLRPEQNTKH